eukprot:PhF_6_TR21010/c0_g1_i2/m.30183
MPPLRPLQSVLKLRSPQTVAKTKTEWQKLQSLATKTEFKTFSTYVSCAQESFHDVPMSQFQAPDNTWKVVDVPPGKTPLLWGFYKPIMSERDKALAGRTVAEYVGRHPRCHVLYELPYETSGVVLCNLQPEQCTVTDVSVDCQVMVVNRGITHDALLRRIHPVTMESEFGPIEVYVHSIGRSTWKPHKEVTLATVRITPKRGRVPDLRDLLRNVFGEIVCSPRVMIDAESVTCTVKSKEDGTTQEYKCARDTSSVSSEGISVRGNQFKLYRDLLSTRLPDG